MQCEAHQLLDSGTKQALVDELDKLFNECIKSNLFPNEWKCAIVTPLYKNKGDRSDLNNYRGISVLAPIAKLFEKYIAAQIFSYFELNKLFFIGQHGFRKNFSCETAMHEIISEINSNLDKRLVTMLLLIDFKKAFDVVDIDLLLQMFPKIFHKKKRGVMNMS
jgi:hypothetical protein